MTPSRRRRVASLLIERRERPPSAQPMPLPEDLASRLKFHGVAFDPATRRLTLPRHPRKRDAAAYYLLQLRDIVRVDVLTRALPLIEDAGENLEGEELAIVARALGFIRDLPRELSRLGKIERDHMRCKPARPRGAKGRRPNPKRAEAARTLLALRDPELQAVVDDEPDGDLLAHLANDAGLSLDALIQAAQAVPKAKRPKGAEIPPRIATTRKKPEAPKKRKAPVVPGWIERRDL